MDTTTLDFNTLTLLVTLLVAILGSTFTIVTLMYRQFDHLDTKIGNLDTRVAGLETNVSALDTKFDALDGKVDALETRLSGRIDSLDAKFDRMGRDVSDSRERLARIEGHLLAPEGSRMRSPQSSSSDEPAPEDPNPDHRQTG